MSNLKWIYLDEEKPEHGQDILVLFSNGCPAVTEHKWHSVRGIGEYAYAEAWIPAPEKRKRWVPCRPDGSLFKSPGGNVECRFKRRDTPGEWLYGEIEAISLDGLSFWCGRKGADPEWVSICEVVECP